MLVCTCRSTPRGSRVHSAISQQRDAALEVREVLGGGCEVKGLSQHAALNGALSDLCDSSASQR